MYEYLPILIVGAIIGAFTLVFTVAYLVEKNRKEKAEFDRHMEDREIIRRLLVYARPYRRAFGIVLVLLVFSIA